VIVNLRHRSAPISDGKGSNSAPTTGAQIYIPKGFAHGFQTLTEDAEVAYQISAFYAPEAAAG